MKKELLIKILLVLMIFSLILMLNNCFFETTAASDAIFINPDDYEADVNGRVENADKVTDIANDIIGIIRIIGTILSVVVLVVIGIKYMIGSVEERAEYKKTMWPYLLGAILVFSITNILGIIVDISGSLFE